MLQIYTVLVLRKPVVLTAAEVCINKFKCCGIDPISVVVWVFFCCNKVYNNTFFIIDLRQSRPDVAVIGDAYAWH